MCVCIWKSGLNQLLREKLNLEEPFFTHIKKFMIENHLLNTSPIIFSYLFKFTLHRSLIAGLISYRFLARILIMYTIDPEGQYRIEDIMYRCMWP